MGKRWGALLFIFLISCSPARSEDDLSCLSRVIYHEARGESFIGQVAVGWVVMNRLHDGRYGQNICDVVYQKGQFTDFFVSSRGENLVTKETARAVLDGEWGDPTGGVRCFYAQKKFKGPKGLVIGNHTFWGCK